MRLARLSVLATLLILTFGTGCDNVDWGGAEVTIVPPPPRATSAPAETETDQPEVERLPQGPILYYVERLPGSGTATIHPLAEIDDDSLRAFQRGRDPQRFMTRFIAEFMRQGAEFLLFSGGARAGQLVIQSAEPAAGASCPAMPRGTGLLELSAAADSINEFLALSRQTAPQVTRRISEGLGATRTMEYVSTLLAERELRPRGARLPGNYEFARKQAVSIPLKSSASPGFSATYLLSDTLGVGLDNDGWSLFFIAEPSSSQAGYEVEYTDYRDYSQTGKAAPRVVDYLDWNRDEQVDLLIRVYGLNDTWFEAVSRNDNGEWQKTFSDRCEESAGG